jgi:hypothetical protein
MSKPPPMRFTPVQMRKLSRIYWVNYVGVGTGEHWKKVSRWFVYGQPDPDKGTRGGHTVFREYWGRDEALVLWAVIHTLLKLQTLSGSERAAYKRRRARLVKDFGLSPVDTLGAISWLEG